MEVDGKLGSFLLDDWLLFLHLALSELVVLLIPLTNCKTNSRHTWHVVAMQTPSIACACLVGACSAPRQMLEMIRERIVEGEDKHSCKWLIIHVCAGLRNMFVSFCPYIHSWFYQFILVTSGPSGSGKTTFIDVLTGKARRPLLQRRFLLPHTLRLPEKDGSQVDRQWPWPQRCECCSVLHQLHPALDGYPSLIYGVVHIWWYLQPSQMIINSMGTNWL